MGEWLHRKFNSHHVHIQSFVDHMTQYNRKFEMHNTGHLREHEWHWIEKLIALGSPHDEHTEMQSTYLANCTNIQAFNFGKTLSQDINRHFETQYNIHPDWYELDIRSKMWCIGICKIVKRYYCRTSKRFTNQILTCIIH